MKTAINYLHTHTPGATGKEAGLGLGKKKKYVEDALKTHLKTWKASNKSRKDLDKLIDGIKQTFSKVHPKWESRAQRKAMLTLIKGKKVEKVPGYRENLKKLYKFLYLK